MKALTVRQPWAWLIVIGYKDVENRTWRTAYRGRFLIHAAQKVDEQAMAKYARLFPLNRHVQLLPRGALIGAVNLVDCVEWCNSPWFTGPVGWVLEGAEEIEPIPAKGMLGLWEYEEESDD